MLDGAVDARADAGQRRRGTARCARGSCTRKPAGAGSARCALRDRGPPSPTPPSARAPYSLITHARLLAALVEREVDAEVLLGARRLAAAHARRVVGREHAADEEDGGERARAVVGDARRSTTRRSRPGATSAHTAFTSAVLTYQPADALISDRAWRRRRQGAAADDQERASRARARASSSSRPSSARRELAVDARRRARDARALADAGRQPTAGACWPPTASRSAATCSSSPRCRSTGRADAVSARRLRRARAQADAGDGSHAPLPRSDHRGARERRQVPDAERQPPPDRAQGARRQDHPGAARPRARGRLSDPRAQHREGAQPAREVARGACACTASWRASTATARRRVRARVRGAAARARSASPIASAGASRAAPISRS